MKFENPLKFTNINDLFAGILEAVIIMSIPVIVFLFILAGFKYVTARGNPEQIQEASKALWYGVIGGVIIIGAVAILAIIKNVVGQF
jgi:hypothetical protein